MKKEYTIIIFVSILLIFTTILFLNNSMGPTVISSDGFTVKPDGNYITISGNIEIKSTMDSVDYKFTPDFSEMYKIENTGQNKIALKDFWESEYTDILRSIPNEKNIRVHGYLLQSSDEYIKDIYTGFPIILVEKIEILN